ncbi:unnamed protein product [Cyclocybe aegerita]|uniref:Uncharacterized protein n=1 Tax=Cyclocybe aegerita TaxID=1973307 RepID=A0A8S0VUL7_CYCAE|nr:unnamed protein product [Cyclocybe aegerita]
MSMITSRPEPSFIPTLEDVFGAQAHLSERVPPELANDILDYAGYWAKVSTSFPTNNGTGKVISARHKDNLNSAEVLVLTPTMENWIGLDFFKIREVRFKLESHDQGWADENSSPLPYLPSWTWFEATIIRDPRYTASTPEEDAFVKKALEKSRRGQETKSSIITVPNLHAAAGLGEDMWDIQRNVRASSVFRSHEILFKEDSNDVASGKTPGKIGNDGMTGAGSGDGFVSALQKEDRIAVIARARKLRWDNHVKEIEVEVYYSV